MRPHALLWLTCFFRAVDMFPSSWRICSLIQLCLFRCYLEVTLNPCVSELQTSFCVEKVVGDYAQSEFKTVQNDCWQQCTVVVGVVHLFNVQIIHDHYYTTLQRDLFGVKSKGPTQTESKAKRRLPGH